MLGFLSDFSVKCGEISYHLVLEGEAPLNIPLGDLDNVLSRMKEEVAVRIKRSEEEAAAKVEAVQPTEIIEE